jgi:hypothetical protein
VSIKGAKAERLAEEILRRLAPHLPPGGEVKIVVFGRSRAFEHGPAIGGGASPIISFGSPVPAPRRLAQKMAVMDAVETVLLLGYELDFSDTRGRKQFAVTATIDGDLVRVSYRQAHDGARVELDPLPLALI